MKKGEPVGSIRRDALTVRIFIAVLNAAVCLPERVNVSKSIFTLNKFVTVRCLHVEDI